MAYLADTHILIWWLVGDRRLSARVLKLLDDPAQAVFISSVSLHEYAIKAAAGGMPITPAALEQVWPQLQLELLAFSPAATVGYQSVKLAHKDPFDRALIVQALANNLTFITADQQILNQSIPNLKLL